MDASSLNHGVSWAPYLALKHVAGSDRPIFYSVSEKKMHAGDEAGELTNTNSWATPQGWILVRDAPSLATYLVDPRNPTDTGRIPLPHLHEENLSTFCTCLLSDYYPANPAQTSSSCCHVLLVETDAPIIWYCRIGDKEWTRHEYDIGTLDYDDGHSEKLVICPIVACRGKFYFNGCDFTEVGVIAFCPEPVFSSITINNAITIMPKGCWKTFMIESAQELYMVSLMSCLDLDVVHRFSVHKMDFVRDEWIQVDDIGDDRVFLLASWYFGASRPADECGLQRNCVYVPYPWNKVMMVFNLRDGTTELQDLDGTPACDQALWILPTHP
ncbi:unnamed protein product [Urochloa humidicola]